ncbi:MAG TPA: DUF2330 domain-containing protein [Polyangia bacterium]|nr:DUF2330 domain-containing protein [Polyangia bacterium]
MTPRSGRVWVAALLLAAGLCTTAWTSSVARACAEFLNGSVAESDRRPSLAYEQTLILFDADKHREHFVREVVFRASRKPFGFVVPTPTRPEVAKVKNSPFAELRDSFPFRKTRSRGVVAAATELGEVDVLEVTKVGRFTAFVLRASDAAGFSSWLSQNGFVSTPETATWLAHYVKLGFFFVAMRYEPARADKGKTTSETIRISFDSPFPYYPYFEPAPPRGTSSTRPRLLEIWLASTRDYVPVARRSREKPDWVRPFLSGSLYAAEVHSLLASAVDSTLLPAGRLQLRRFADQKRSRVGFGDVVFVPVSPDERGPAPDALRAFTEILDPAAEPPPAVSDLLTGKAPASKLPEVATEPGRSFDPDLRDRIAPLPEGSSTVIDGDADARF